jgi:peptidoglycan/LPS O-acetylase OafA/YrhL
MSPQGVKQILTQVTFTHYYTPDTASSLNVNGALWTLTIEMMLYAFLPIMALAVRFAPWTFFTILVGIGFGWRTYVALDGEALRSFYFGDARVDVGIQSLFLARQFIGALPVFALGILTRWLFVHGKFDWLYGRLRRMNTLSFLLLAIPSVLMLRLVEPASDYHHTFLFVTFDFLTMVALVPALVVAAYPGEFTPSPLRTVTTWLGVRSYSIYLWHFPLILSLYERGPLTAPPAAGGYAWRLPAILVLTLLFASASYAAVERPGMELGRNLSRRLTRPKQLKEPVSV